MAHTHHQGHVQGHGQVPVALKLERGLVAGGLQHKLKRQVAAGGHEALRALVLVPDLQPVRARAPPTPRISVRACAGPSPPPAPDTRPPQHSTMCEAESLHPRCTHGQCAGNRGSRNSPFKLPTHATAPHHEAVWGSRGHLNEELLHVVHNTRAAAPGARPARPHTFAKAAAHGAGAAPLLPQGAVAGVGQVGFPLHGCGWWGHRGGDGEGGGCGGGGGRGRVGLRTKSQGQGDANARSQASSEQPGPCSCLAPRPSHGCTHIQNSFGAVGERPRPAGRVGRRPVVPVGRVVRVGVGARVVRLLSRHGAHAARAHVMVRAAAAATQGAQAFAGHLPRRREEAR